MESVNGDIMVSVIMLIFYLIFVLLVGVKLYGKVDNWFFILDRIIFIVEIGKVLKYGFLVFMLVVVFEFFVLYFIFFDVGFLFLLFVVGFVEEGVKFFLYFCGGDEFYCWRLIVKVVLIFVVIEVVFYGVIFFFFGNILGVFFRVVVVMYYVFFMVIVFEMVLRGFFFFGLFEGGVVLYFL